MPDIFLYSGEVSPADIRLGDPTQATSLVGIPIHAGGAPPRIRQVYCQALFLPLYVAVAATANGWLAPLSVAAPVAKAQPGFASVPFDTAQPARNFATTIPLPMGGAAPQVRSLYYQARVEPPYVPPVVAATTPYGWQAQLSSAATVAKAQAGFASVALATFAAPTVQWQPPLSSPLPLPKAQPGWSFVPYNTAQLAVNYSNFGWYQPLAGAPLVAKALQGFSSVPYDTAQIIFNTVTIDKWQVPLSVAPSVAKARQGESFVPFNTAQLSVNFTNIGWHQALSGAPAVARAQPGSSFVPFNTAQLSVNYTAFYQQPLSIAAPVARAIQGFSFVPYNTAQLSVNFTPVGWQAPLSGAPSVAKAPLADWSLPYVTVAGIAGMAWFTPLWSVPTRNLTAPQGNSFVPYNTAQIVVTTPGQRRPTLFIANVGRLMNH